MKPEDVEKATQPFKEKTELVDGFISEIREKLGEDEASKISDTLLGLQSTITEAADLHTAAVTDRLKFADRNKQLVEVNNDLYIKNSNAIKGVGDKPNTNNADDMDDDEALRAYINGATETDKK
jgi:hypothetical protein